MEYVFKIFRFDPEKNKKPYFMEYNVKLQKGQTILDGLNEIKWYKDGGVTYRRSCRSAICGSCAILINGKNRLACNTQAETLRSKKITLEPLPAFPIIKDLVIQVEPFFEKIEKIKPYLITKTPSPEKERIQSQIDRKKLDTVINCILCGICTTSCPTLWTNKEYLGPASFNKAYRFIIDSRDEGAEEHLEAVNDEGTGIWRCHTILNCFEACPKKIDLTSSIGGMKVKLSNL